MGQIFNGVAEQRVTGQKTPWLCCLCEHKNNDQGKLATSIDEWWRISSSFCVRGDLVVHGMHGESIVCRWGMGGQEDDGVIDEEERHHIDEAWRKS